MVCNDITVSLPGWVISNKKTFLLEKYVCNYGRFLVQYHNDRRKTQKLDLAEIFFVWFVQVLMQFPLHGTSECNFNEYRYYNEHFPLFSVKCPKIRQKTERELKILLESFEANTYPVIKEKRELAKSLNTTLKAIDNWFGYMRRKKSRDGTLERSE